MKLSEESENIENRIESLSKIAEESARTVVHLNKIVVEYKTAKDNEIKKGRTLKSNINKLKRKLNRLKE